MTWNPVDLVNPSIDMASVPRNRVSGINSLSTRRHPDNAYSFLELVSHLEIFGNSSLVEKSRSSQKTPDYSIS